MTKYIHIVVFAVFLQIFGGCQESSSDRQFLIVDYQRNQPIKYKMVSDRKSIIDLDPSGKMSKGGKGSAKQIDEKLEITVAINLLEIDKDGYLTVEFKYDAVNAIRIGATTKGADAVEALTGKSAVVKMTPAGLIVDDSSLVNLIQQVGEKAFSGAASDGEVPIKSEDMIGDFVALQYYMFDVLGSVQEPLDGIKNGQKWSSELFVPLPVAANVGRKVNYTFNGVTHDPNIGANIAVITSDYEMIARPKSLQNIYKAKSYRQKGFFGVLRCKPKGLVGNGEILYDLDKGILLKDFQQYELEMSAALFLPLPGLDEGLMRVSQKLLIEKIE